MRARMIWPCMAIVLLLASAVACHDEPSQSTSSAVPNQAPAPDAEEPSDPNDEARSAVDLFLWAYNRPEMDTADVNAFTSRVARWCGWLALMRDFRIVKPFIKCLADTTPLPDDARQNMLRTLGVLGDMAAAKVVMKHAVDTTMAPLVRYEAAVAICFLGNAQTGTQVLKKLALANALPPDYTFTPWQFLDSKGNPKKLKSAADEKAVTFFFRWLAERAKGQALVDAVKYLLQRDEESRELACQVAERALKDPQVYLPELPHTRARVSMLDMLTWYGGDRGKALAARFEK